MKCEGYPLIHLSFNSLTNIDCLQQNPVLMIMLKCVTESKVLLFLGGTVEQKNLRIRGQQARTYGCDSIPMAYTLIEGLKPHGRQLILGMMEQYRQELYMVNNHARGFQITLQT